MSNERKQSKLGELLRELCPEGVEYKPLGEVVRFLNGRAYKQAELLDEGKYKVLRVGNFYTNDKWYYSDLELDEDKYCENGDLLYTWAATLGPQIWSGERVIFHYHIWKLVLDETVLDKKFLYYFLAKDIDDISKSLTKSTMPHVSMASMNKRLVPVPPLPVQREIVRILDKFTERTAALIAELTAELTARKKQYEFYRNKLLTFDDVRGGATSDVVWKSLAEIADISTGSSNTDDAVEGGCYPFFVRSQQPLAKDEYEYDEEAIITAGDGVGVGKVFHYINGKYALHQRAYRIHPATDGLLGKYLYHYFVATFPKYIGQQMYQGSVPSIRRPMLNKFQVAIPSLDVQSRIVNVLDNFDAICSDLKIGLPAEIEARKKQYEFYREKLLAFHEISN